MTLPQQETLNALVARVFRIEDVTLGEDGKEYLYRYRGNLAADDSAAAYDQLAESLRPHGLLPLFRKDKDGGHLILLVRAPAAPQRLNPRTNIILFVLTVVSVMMAGVEIPANLPMPADAIGQMVVIYKYIFTGWHILTGWPFALSLLSILLAHEFGHYFAGRFHKAALSLPYFIPLPLAGGIGTMGAVIRLQAPPKNKRILLDIGIAGPLAGLVVAIPVLLLGLHMSPLTYNVPSATGFEGNSLLYLFLKYITFGQLLPAPASYGSLPPLLYWLRYFVTGMPAPVGGTDVLLNSVAWAGWVGLLVTALNLIPAGQLDGGHVLYVLIGGKRLRALLPVIQTILVILGFFSVSWWLFLAILSLVGRVTDDPLDQITELDPKRRALAIFGIVVFLLVFMPVPIPAPIFSF